MVLKIINLSGNRIRKMKRTILFTFMKQLKICVKIAGTIIYHIYNSGIMHYSLRQVTAQCVKKVKILSCSKKELFFEKSKNSNISPKLHLYKKDFQSTLWIVTAAVAFDRRNPIFFMIDHTLVFLTTFFIYSKQRKIEVQQ